MKRRNVTVGLKSKTGRAIAVALSEPASSPEFVHREELQLSDARRPATMQPYHEVMDLRWPDAIRAAEPFVRALEAVASTAFGALLRQLESKGLVVRRVGIIGSLDKNLERFGNPHIRAHAAEGMLFRRILETAASAHGIAYQSFSDKDLMKSARLQLGLSPSRSASRLKALGVEAGPPWRSEEKSAATAAWIALRAKR